jgi:hypothetical protein
MTQDHRMGRTWAPVKSRTRIVPDERPVQSVSGPLLADRLLENKVKEKPDAHHDGVKHHQVGKDLGPTKRSAAQNFPGVLKGGNKTDRSQGFVRQSSLLKSPYSVVEGIKNFVPAASFDGRSSSWSNFVRFRLAFLHLQPPNPRPL